MPINLANLYSQLSQRVSIHVPDICADVSVMLPTRLDDELAFYRLVNWGYVLVSEAAKIPFDFLTRLPPLRSDGSLQKDIGRLRTIMAHNLDVKKTRDKNTLAFTHFWFREACGVGTPRQSGHYKACCAALCNNLQVALEGAIDACDALDDITDGVRLVEDLECRVDLHWNASRFDPIVADCANRFGNPGLDLLAIRRRNLDAWRRILKTASESDRERAIILDIERALIAAIGDTLPVTAAEASKQLAISGADQIVTALLLLRDARRFGDLKIPKIIEQVSAEALHFERELSK